MASDILKEVDKNEIPTLLEEFKDFNKYFLVYKGKALGTVSLYSSSEEVSNGDEISFIVCVNTFFCYCAQLNQLFQMHQYLTIMLELKEAKVESPKQTLFRYGGVEDGVYLLESDFPEVPFTSYFTFTASEDLADLGKALLETKRIPWERRAIHFEVTLDKFQPIFRQIAEEKKIEFIWKHNVMVWLPPEDPLDVGEVPEGMFLSCLNKSHAAEINKNWPHGFPGSEIYLGQQIMSNFGWGLFRKSDSKMACTTLTFHSGGIFVLFTDPEFRGSGCAELIVRKTCQTLREMGRIPFAGILNHNIPSQKLFQKCGFKQHTKIFFLQLI